MGIFIVLLLKCFDRLTNVIINKIFNKEISMKTFLILPISSHKNPPEIKPIMLAIPLHSMELIACPVALSSFGTSLLIYKDIENEDTIKVNP